MATDLQQLWKSIGMPPASNNGGGEQPPPEPPAPSIADLLADVVDGLKALQQPVAIKGRPVRVFSNQAFNKLSDKSVDCNGANAVHIDVLVSGTNSPSATLTVKGAQESGAAYATLPDPAAVRTGVTANVSYDVPVGSRWVKVDLSAISGTFGSDSVGYTVTVTPYVSGSLMGALGGVYSATPPTLSDGQAGGLQLDLTDRLRVNTGPWKVVGIQTGLTIDNTARSLTVPAGAVTAILQVFTASVRFWTDGTAPTTTTGLRAGIYDQIRLQSPDELSNFKAIRETAASADIEAIFYG